MLEDLRAAIDDGDWPRALTAGLVAWRKHRVAALADIIDHLAARCPRVRPTARKGIHAWWVAHALGYDERNVEGLVATLEGQLHIPFDIDEVGARHATNQLVISLSTHRPQHGLQVFRSYAAWIDCLCFILDWHDDPRWGPVLARWLAPPRRQMTAWIMGPSNPQDTVYGTIARRLGELGDVRALPILENGTVAEDAIADPTIAKLRTMPLPSPALAAEIAAIADVIVPRRGSPRDPDLEARLWADVASAPDDDAPRLVLADYLTQHGDPRGELIVLQQTETPRAKTHADKLISQHRSEWLGPLVVLCTRKGTIWRRGMIDELRIGMLETTDRAIDAVRGHRELGCVRVVIPATIGAAHFARVVDALPNPPVHVVLDSVEMVLALEQHRPRWPFRIVELGSREAGGWAAVHPEPLLVALGRIAPDLEELVLLPMSPHVSPRKDVLVLFARIHDWLPRLQRLLVPQRELDVMNGRLPFATGYAGPVP